MASGNRDREQVYGDGDVEGGMWWAGQAEGLIQDIGSCQTVIGSILDEAKQIITRALPEQLRE